MLKRLCVFVVLAVAVVLAAAPAAKAEHVFIFFLTGDQETPAVPTGAFGYGVAVLSDDATAVMFGLAYGGLEFGNVTAAHFHEGPYGVAGGVRRTFNPPDFGSPDGYVVDMWLSTDREAL